MAEQPWIQISLGITVWYLTSFGTLLLNKHLLGTRHIKPNTLAVVQMVSTAIYGAMKTLSIASLLRLNRELWRLLNHYGWQGNMKVHDLELGGGDAGTPKGHGLDRLRRGLMQMCLVGLMRFSTVVLGLVSLQHVAASFTETIKSSAPFFTVVIAYLMLGERTSLQVLATLVPVAGGLVLASSTEASFNVVGFCAAVLTNVIECVQNVFSKRLLAREYTASQLQFYTSLTALFLQAPMLVLTLDSGTDRAVTLSEVAARSHGTNSTILVPSLGEWGLLEQHLPYDHETMALLWLDGVLYHAQSVVAYVVMSYLSPVTVSVVNTLKRALLIWISVQVFGNQVTPMAVLGTAICLGGALWYNFARNATSPKQ